MTTAKLIDDLRARYPTFTVVWEGDLIRVEMPEPFVQAAWLRLNTSTGEVKVAAPRQAIFTGHVGYDNVAIAHYDHVGEALWRVACQWASHHIPMASSVAEACGGPFAAQASAIAQTYAAAAAARADRIRSDADAALSEAKREYANRLDVAEMWADRAAAYAALVKP